MICQDRAMARVPAWALGLSLVLHGAFFAMPTSSVRRSADVAVSIQATLRTLPSDRVRPESDAWPKAAAHAERPAHGRAVMALRQEAAPDAASHATEAATPTGPPVQETLARSSTEAAPVEPPPEAGARASDFDSDVSMTHYTRQLAELLGRNRQYPRLAALRGWEGEVQLRVTVARKGAIVAVQVLRSSGFAELDRAALRLVQEATPLPQLPAALQEREFQIVVPIFYRLEKAT